MRVLVSGASCILLQLTLRPSIANSINLIQNARHKRVGAINPIVDLIGVRSACYLRSYQLARSFLLIA